MKKPTLRIDLRRDRWYDMGSGFYLHKDLRTILITRVATEEDTNDVILDLCTACNDDCEQCDPETNLDFGETSETFVILRQLEFVEFKDIFLTLLGEIRLRGGSITG